MARVRVRGAGGLFCGRIHYLDYREGACEGKVDVRRNQLCRHSILDAWSDAGGCVCCVSAWTPGPVPVTSRSLESRCLCERWLPPCCPHPYTPRKGASASSRGCREERQRTWQFLPRKEKFGIKCRIYDVDVSTTDSVSEKRWFLSLFLWVLLLVQRFFFPVRTKNFKWAQFWWVEMYRRESLTVIWENWELLYRLQKWADSGMLPEA